MSFAGKVAYVTGAGSGMGSHIAELLAERGATVNISSVFADRGPSRRAAHSASKHGIRGLTRSRLAVDGGFLD